MYRTIWSMEGHHNNFNSKEKNFEQEVELYHFNKEPRFPSWVLEDNYWYVIKMDWNLKLEKTPINFWKCLIKYWEIRTKK